MRIAPIAPTTTDPAIAPLYAQTKAALGGVPNLVQVLGTSPGALRSWLGQVSALSQGRFNAALRERIALAVAQTNLCDYCLAAHSLLGGHAGLDAAEQQRARFGTASDPYAAAAVAFAIAVTKARGQVQDPDLAAARRAGLDDGALVEIVAHVAMNIFTNYINHVAATTIDFPAAPALAARA